MCIRDRKGGNPLALLATLYMLAAGLPRQIGRVMGAISGMNDVDAGDAAEGATADAGDDADANDDGGENGSKQVYSTEQAAEAVQRSAKLLARGMAAKEVSSKSLAVPAKEAPKSEPEAAIQEAPAASKMKRAQTTNIEQEMDEEAGENDGGGGGD